MRRWLKMRGLALVATLPMTGCFNSILLTPTNHSAPVEETTVVASDGLLCWDKVVIIDVDGMLLNHRSSGLFSEGDNPVSLFRERLDAAASDSRVKAVVLRINSPGGGVTASDIMYHDLLAFKQKTGIPVVACMMDVAASGAFYLAMAADYVYAHPTTVTGSIGVIMSLYNASGLAAKIGIASNPIKSGPIKDIGNPLREMTDAEREVLQRLVNSFYDQFVHVVCTGRRLPEDQVRHLADGRVYAAPDAKAFGLIDEIGYLEDAIHCAKGMAHLADASIVAYDRGGGCRGSVYAGLPHIPSNINVHIDLPGLSGSQGAAFMYIWDPGVVR